LIAHVACLRDFAGELWIVAQQAGHFRKLMRQQQQVNQINRPNFEKLLRDGKAITAEQLKKVHATVSVRQVDQVDGMLARSNRFAVASRNSASLLQLSNVASNALPFQSRWAKARSHRSHDS
jgi:hypothetical protein